MIGETIEAMILSKVASILREKKIPELSGDFISTDNFAEVLEKLIIVHIRMWMLEDLAGLATSDEELASLKRRIDICFKQKRPQYVQAINRLIDNAIISGRSLVEDSVKAYAGHTNKTSS